MKIVHYQYSFKIMKSKIERKKKEIMLTVIYSEWRKVEVMLNQGGVMRASE